MTLTDKVREDMTIEEQKDRARLLKEMGPLAQAWDSYQNLRKVCGKPYPWHRN